MVYTKRGLLSIIPTKFDTLQLWTLFVTEACILMQETWIRGLDWDEQLQPIFTSMW